MKTKFTYAEIRVKDLDASIAFYTKVLGMKDLGRGTVDGRRGRPSSTAMRNGAVVHLDRARRHVVTRQGNRRTLAWRNLQGQSPNPSPLVLTGVTSARGPVCPGGRQRIYATCEPCSPRNLPCTVRRTGIHSRTTVLERYEGSLHRGATGCDLYWCNVTGARVC